MIFNILLADNYYNYETSEIDTLYFNDFELNEGGFYDPDGVSQIDQIPEDELWTRGTTQYINSSNEEL